MADNHAAFPYDLKTMRNSLRAARGSPGRGGMIDDARFRQLIEQAEVASDKLTGSKHWKVYQQILQNLANHAAETRDEVIAALQDPAVVKTEDVQLLRADVFRLNERLLVLELCLDIPKMIVDEGKTAKQVLDGIVEQDAESGSEKSR